ncbi:MAG: D-alanyl-D-alanine carboxypeptidase [Lachnospiraceae bacterium]|nr:D-alanyl-D-alanine carboxypeptidase [Lachnospiraceae bacterium]
MIRTITATIIISIITAATVFSLPVGNIEVQCKEREEEPWDIHAQSAVLIDGENGRVLFGKNPDEKRSIASTTKIMTCIIALENSSPDDIVEVSSRAAAMPKVNMRTKAGEKYKMNDLLYAMMLESYNDVAVAIAEHISGSVENFAVLMNEKAVALGAYNTNFVTPNGLDADNHYSTAYDMALIGAYAIREKRFLEIVNKKTHSFNEMTGKRCIIVNNKNGFLGMESESIGIKTGFTGKAGYCFVGAVDNNGHRLISVVLGSGWPPNKTFKWNDTKRLIAYGRKHQ